MAEATANLAREAGVSAITVQVDATDEKEVETAVKQAAHSLGGLDILINMAAIYLSTANPTEGDWSEMLDTNAKSIFLFSVQAASVMKRS
ncbi:MAG TPA: SDR family NAD(P)-dependent oxidoreductase, partial [Candidatus Binataceae bacterium]|nr:SDR family NAD(P)-dependent oxidoreductase [Candidatus Binataceae bacterium]